MIGLTNAEVAALLSNPAQGRGSKASKFALVSSDGQVERVALSSVSAADVGRFIGKTSGKSRGRKGNIRPKLDGWRKYDGVAEIEVIAYLA